MQFSFSSANLPTSLRICRGLVWTEAAFVILGGVFAVFTAILFGGSNSIPFHDGTVSGGGAAMLGAVYIGAGLALAWLGVELGHLAPWARTVIVSLQVFLAVLEVFRSFDLSASTIISVALYLAIVALLFAPGTERALHRAPAA